VHCNNTYKVDVVLIGKRFKCKHCGEVFYAAPIAELIAPESPSPPTPAAPTAPQPAFTTDELDQLLGPQTPGPSPFDTAEFASPPTPSLANRSSGDFNAKLAKATKDPWIWGVAAASLLSMIVLPIVSAPGVAIILLSIAGLGLLAWGIMSPLRRRDKKSSDHSGYGTAGSAGVSVLSVISAIAIVYNRVLRNKSLAKDVDSATLLGWVVAMVALAVVLLMLWKLRKRGAHRILSLVYITAFLITMLLNGNISKAVIAGLTPRELPAEKFVLQPIEPTLPGNVASKPNFAVLVPGVERATIRLGIHKLFPGHEDMLRIYRPAGTAGKKLPCVFIAPAGTPLIWGNKHGDSDGAEHVPYVKAGFMVIAYDLDGPLDNPQAATDKQAVAAISAFIKAKAGLVNARNAIDYAVRDIPEVDANRLYTAGHSSAGTLALLLEAVEPRIKGCCAYAPVTNVEDRIATMFNHDAKMMTPLRGFAQLTSPSTHTAEINRPTFLFCADDDSNVSCAEVTAFANSLKQGKFKHVPTGEHYQAMIDQGLPAGVSFLCGLAKIAAPAAPPTNRANPSGTTPAFPGENQVVDVPPVSSPPIYQITPTIPTPLVPVFPRGPQPQPNAPGLNVTEKPANPIGGGATFPKHHYDEGDAWGDWHTTKSAGISGDLEWLENSRNWSAKQYADVLAPLNDAKLASVRWNPGFSRPCVGHRWGVGFVFVANNNPPSMLTQWDMSTYTGQLGLQVGKRLQSLQLAGKFGSLDNVTLPTLKFVQLLGSGTKTDLISSARTMGLETLCLVELKTDVQPGTKRSNTLMSAKFVDVCTEQQGWVTAALSSAKAQGGESVASLEWLQKYSEGIEEKFVLGDPPANAADLVKEDFAAWRKKKPTHALAACLEIRVAQQRKWIDDAEANSLTALVLGEATAQSLAAADEMTRHAMLMKMLPK
jgi:dienelactone hydrolase